MGLDRKWRTSINPQISQTENTATIGDDGDTGFVPLGPVLQDILDISFVVDANVLKAGGVKIISI